MVRGGGLLAVLAAAALAGCDAVTVPGHDETDIYGFALMTEPPAVFRWPAGNPSCWTSPTTPALLRKRLLARSPKSLRLIETCPEDRPFAVQIFGHDPKVMQDAVLSIEDARFSQ